MKFKINLSYIIILFCASITVSKASINNELTDEDKESTVPLINNYHPKITSYTQSIIVDNTEKEVIQWLDKIIFNQSSSISKCAKVGIFVIEVFSGLARGAVYFKLGYKLAERIVSSVSSPGKEILSSIYGAGVAIPMTILGASTSGDFFKKMISKKHPEEKNIEYELTKLERVATVGVKSITLTFSAISSTTVTYLTYAEFKDIGWFWLVGGVPNFYVRTLLDYYAIPELVKTVYGQIKTPLDRCIAKNNPNSRQDYMTAVKDRLESSQSFITSLNHTQASNLLKNFTEEKESLLKQIKILTHPEEFIEDPVLIQRDSVLKKVVGFVGGCVGIYGTWIYLSATEIAFNSILSLIPDINESVIASVSKGLAIIALTSASAITAIATSSSVMKFYEGITGVCTSIKNKFFSWFYGSENEIQSNLHNDQLHKKKRLAVAILSTILAAWNASQLIEVAIEFNQLEDVLARLELVASLITQFSFTFWAVDEALLSLLKAGDPREPLLEKIEKIRKKLPDMSDKHLGSLRNILDRSLEKIVI